MDGDNSTSNYESLRRQVYDSIPEFEAFEGEKENVLPRRQGRRATDLIAAFNTDPDERQEEISQGHEQFAREIETADELDDPLDVYIRYIAWTEAMYPQGHNQGSDLLGLLEHTTQRFQNHAQYKNDARYLGCWIHYVKYADQPNEIYQLMMKKGIGQELALFYESYASYLERRGRLKEAGDIYQAGIEREARPLQRLRRHHEEFQNRSRKHERVDQDRRPQASSSTSSRMVLGHKTDARSSVSTSPRRLNLSPGISSSSVISPAPRFSVYSGPELATSPSASTPHASSSSSSSISTTITSTSRRPENQVPVSKFAGTTLPQKPYARPAPLKFQVFRDEANEYSFSGSDTTLTDRFVRIQPNAIRIKSSKGADEFISATRDCFTEQTDDFLSFEELRARHYAEKTNTDDDEPLPESGGFHDYHKPKLPEPPTDYTTETIAAMQAVDSLFSKGKNMSIDDDEVVWNSKRQKTGYHNENEDSHLADKRYDDDRDRIPFMSRSNPEPFFDDVEPEEENNDEDDLEAFRRDMMEEALMAEKMQNQKRAFEGD